MPRGGGSSNEVGRCGMGMRPMCGASGVGICDSHVEAHIRRGGPSLGLWPWGGEAREAAGIRRDS